MPNDVIQQFLQGTSRALVEGDLTEGEPGYNSDSDFLELIHAIKGGGFAHFPSEEKLSQIVKSTKSGAQFIGVDGTPFTVLTGNTDLQEVLEEIDLQLSALQGGGSGFVTLATNQTITGNKVFNSNIELSKLLTLTPHSQLVDTDGGPGTEVLLESSANSFLEITNDITGNPATSYTVGMEAGTENGQICIITLLPLYAIEIDPNVLNSANIVFENGASTLSLSGYNGSVPTQYSSAIFRWNVNTSSWLQLLFTI